METTLLLVDDEEGIRTVLGIALADLGYLVRTAADGRQGLRVFHELQPPIVITDIKMPVMDGIELLQRIKHESPDTEVIVLTGHGDMDLAIRCLKLEATDFVTKPINDDALEIALKRAHDRIRMRRQLRDYTENLEKQVEEKSAQLVAAERRAAVGQTLEGLTSALQNIAGDLDGGIACFNDLPCLVSIHSPDLKIIAANQRFIDKMGPPANRASVDLYLGEAPCPAEATFSSGQGLRISTTLTYPDGSESPVVVHTEPIRNAPGRVELVLENTPDWA
jgi:FixJ family two-component response regulator